MQAVVCAQARAETPWKLRGGTSGLLYSKDTLVVILNGRWNQGCGGAVAGALAADAGVARGVAEVAGAGQNGAGLRYAVISGTPVGLLVAV